MSPDRQPPLVELRCPSAPADPGWYRFMGSASPLRRWIGLEAFPPGNRASAVETASNAPAPASLLSPSESDRNRTAARPASSSSPGVWSLSALTATEARSPRAYHTRHLPAPGIHTLMPACVLRSLPALFHAGNALRVFLQGFFPPQSLRPLSEPVTFVTLVPRACQPQVAPGTFDPRTSSSRLCSLRGFATAGDWG
jgi:hypothetical protein